MRWPSKQYGIELGLESKSIPVKPAVESAVPPDLKLMASDWVALTPDQQVSFRVQIQAVAECNRKHKGKK